VCERGVCREADPPTRSPFHPIIHPRVPPRRGDAPRTHTRRPPTNISTQESTALPSLTPPLHPRPPAPLTAPRPRAACGAPAWPGTAPGRGPGRHAVSWGPGRRGRPMRECACVWMGVSVSDGAALEREKARFFRAVGPARRPPPPGAFALGPSHRLLTSSAAPSGTTVRTGASVTRSGARAAGRTSTASATAPRAAASAA